MNRFLSSKNTFTVSILWGLVLILFGILYITITTGERNFLSILIVILTISFIVWILLDTRYVIKSNDLLYRSGPFRGRINIFEIKKIESFSGMIPPVTMKPALGNKGLILYHDKYESIFITPEKTKDFVDELLKINPEIEVND
jgi:Bacterial PH domain